VNRLDLMKGLTHPSYQDMAWSPADPTNQQHTSKAEQAAACSSSRSRDSAAKSASAFALSRSTLPAAAGLLLALPATLLELECALATEAVDAMLFFCGVALALTVLPRVLSSGLAPPDGLLVLLERIAGLRAAGEAALPRIAGGLSPAGGAAPVPRVAGLEGAPLPARAPTPCSKADALSAASSSGSSNERGPEPSALGCCHMRRNTAICEPSVLESMLLPASLLPASAKYTSS
jgi:hypothetical protein